MIDKLRDWSQKNPDIASLPFILLAVILLMTLATSGKFLSKGNLNAFASQIPELGLLSLATMVVMITNGINLSIISSANLVGVTMALMMTNWVNDGMGSGMIVLIVLVTLAVGLFLSVFLGWINGALIAYVGLPPMLATLGTMLLYEDPVTNDGFAGGVPVECGILGLQGGRQEPAKRLHSGAPVLGSRFILVLPRIFCV